MAARSMSGGALVLVGLVLAACGRHGGDGGWTAAATAGVGSELKPSWTADVGGGAKMDFVLVPAGSFTMSSDDGLTDPPPSRRVAIAKPFYLARYETTQAQWQAVMGSNPSEFKAQKNPVENVSWDDCRRFLDALNARSHGGGKFVLPTEEQWEYACRAGSTTKWNSGDAEEGVEQCAWFAKDSGQTTHPVGEKKPNAWGLYDMHGNVWEWCDDAPPDECGDGPGRVAANRIFRGGSWYFTAAGARSGSRAWGDAAHLRQPTVGFRVAMNLAR